VLAEHPQLAAEILGRTDAPANSLDELIEVRAAVLVDYQSHDYATRYRTVVGRVIARETAVFGAPGRLSRAAAEGLFQVMAYKDEYEVARLHAAASYGARPVFHLAPPLFSRIDPATGRRRKIALPGWFALPLFRLLRHGKALRGTRLDPFGWQADRRAEVALIETYVADLNAALMGLRPETLDAAVALAELPDMIRGFGPVKEANRAKAAARQKVLRAQLRSLEQREVVAA
jgi:indolepyruvate ferredoxin oxidoreductase